MDKEQLAEEIRRKIGVKVGLRYRTISVNSKQKLSKDQMVPAIHIEIDERNYATNKLKIAQLYESKRTEGFPLGIKMRLCPQVQDATDPTTSTKFDRVRIRQAAFLANIQRTNTWEVGVLDFPDPALNGHSIRSLVMGIRSSKDPDRKVFISVDKHYRGDGICFQYTNKQIDEGTAWIKGLLPYLKTLFPIAVHGQLEKCFSEEAVNRAASCVWDPVKKCVVSAADTAIDAICEDWDLDEEFEFPGMDTSKFELDMSVIQQENKTPPKASGKRATDPQDVDSVSTFKRQRENSATTVTTSNRYEALAGSATSSEASAASSTIDSSRGTAAASFKTIASSVDSQVSQAKSSSQPSVASQGSSKSAQSNISSASAAIIKQKDQTIDIQNLQIQVIMEKLRGLEALFVPTGNAIDPNNSQQPGQAPLDHESSKAGDGDVSGNRL
jgi:hypothetical protein